MVTSEWISFRKQSWQEGDYVRSCRLILTVCSAIIIPPDSYIQRCHPIATLSLHRRSIVIACQGDGTRPQNRAG